MANRRRTVRTCATGFTLVELLIGIVIGVLLIAVVFSTYRVVVLAVGGQADRNAGPRAAYRVLETMNVDLLRTFIPADDDQNLFTLAREEGDAGASILAFTAMMPDPAREDLRFAQAHRLTYQLSGAGESRQLLRSERSLVGPASTKEARGEVLMRNVSRFRVAVFDGSTWQATWPLTDSKQKPRAVRVDLVLAGATNEYSVNIPVPVGITVTSRLVRAVAPGP